MIAKFLTFIYKLSYYFNPPSEVLLDCEDNHDYDLTGQRLTYMSQITKYFIWRKYTLYLLIPFSLTSIILNITNFLNIKKIYNIIKNIKIMMKLNYNMILEIKQVK